MELKVTRRFSNLLSLLPPPHFHLSSLSSSLLAKDVQLPETGVRGKQNKNLEFASISISGVSGGKSRRDPNPESW